MTAHTLAQSLLQQLDMLQLSLSQLEHIDDQLSLTLRSRLTALADQIPLLKTLASISSLVKQGADLPVRRISYNIRKLSENCKPRWDELLKLNCETIIFFTIAFNGLASLPEEAFSWLVQNLQGYVENRAFPRRWILRDQIRKVLSNIPRKDITMPFLAS
jgi:hypothetical protein